MRRTESQRGAGSTARGGPGFSGGPDAKAAPKGGPYVSSSYARGFLLGALAGWCLHYHASNGTAVLLSSLSSPSPSSSSSEGEGGGVAARGPPGDASGVGLLRTRASNEEVEGAGIAAVRADATHPQQQDETADEEGSGDEATNAHDGNTHGDGTVHDSDVGSGSDDAESDPTSPTPLKTFTELLRASGSDKYHRHHFERYYGSWLEPFRHKPGLKMLEIGAKGGRSLAMWDAYFSDAALILGLAYKAGTDQLPERLVNTRHNVSVHFGDQSQLETMQALVEYGPFDIIIDDGSHVPQHILFSLFSLWDQAVVPGGLYVIEDIETSYWRNGSKIYGYQMWGTGIGAKPEHSVVTKLEQIQQVLFRYQIGARTLSNLLPGDQDLCSVEWGMNVAALRKCDDAEFDKPPMQPVVYDEERMEAWIHEARRTNPRGYLGETSAPEGRPHTSQAAEAEAE